MAVKKTQEEFINQAKAIHRSRYDYSKVDYINYHTLVIIICKLHGEFYQSPANHISTHNKNGCPKCVGKNKTNDEFISECEIKHNYTYDYSLTIYKGYYSNISIICKEQGIFNQRAGHHLEGSGCKKCQSYNVTSPDEFKIYASKIHNNKYDYSNAIYISQNNKICIICPIHGKFLQLPSNHIHKQYGCPKCVCRISKHEIDFIDYVKLPNDEYHRQVTLFRKQVDGYDPETNTIYEYFGDYWHGNPWKYDLNDYNKRINKTFGFLYKRTFDRLFLLKSHGYTVKYIWEADWKKFISGEDKEPKIVKY